MSLVGPRSVIDMDSVLYPPPLRELKAPPKCLYVIGDASALEAGLAVIGARKATPYGLGCAQRFAQLAAEKGICIISGGARGCDSSAHRAALAAHGRTVVFLGGGCDKLYPAAHFQLFQQIIDGGGAIASEHPWEVDPRPAFFRMRNRLIAGLAQAVLIVEAGMPSGTFSTADEALDLGKEVLVVPGAITSNTSRGSNRLLLQGAVPVVDDESFEDALFSAFGSLKRGSDEVLDNEEANPIVAAILAEPLTTDQLLGIAKQHCGQQDPGRFLMETIGEAELSGKIARQPDGRWGPAVGKA